MKAIPEQLRAYFPKAVDPARPWWVSVENESCTERRWSDGKDSYSCYTSGDREFNDKRDPLPPPPILVGQVWAMPYDGGFRVGTIVAVEHFDHGGIRADWSNTWYNSTDRGLHIDGFLLSCPYGYAPWSGPEVP